MDIETPRVEFLHGAALAAAVARERRRMERKPVKFIGRLAYGGMTPAVVGCDVIDLSETGVRVATYALLLDVPEFLSLEFRGIYCRVRRRWTLERELGLEFVHDPGAAAGGRG